MPARATSIHWGLFLQRVMLICIGTLYVLVLVTSSYGADFYPLYFAVDRVIHGLSPYGPDATSALIQQWGAPFAPAGVAYPLPFILLVTPLTVLPYPLAVICWIGLGCVLVWGGFVWSTVDRPDNVYSWLVPMAFLPVYRSITLGQATLLWAGISMLVLVGIRCNNSWIVSVCVALLLLKPQTGMVFALYGAYWLWNTRREALWVSIGILGALSVSAFMLQPHWVTDWFSQVASYKSVVRPPSVVVWMIGVMIMLWHSHVWARLAIVQVLAFPLSDLYSGLPLLIAWGTLPAPIALLGASLSWVWLFFGLPNTSDVFIALLVVPLVVASLGHYWYTRIREKRC